MAWRTEDTDERQDLVWDGVEFGIAPSPTKGTANIQNANIATESGEVLASFARTTQQQVAITNGTLTPDGATLFDAPATLKAGTWISVSASTVSGITTQTTDTTYNVQYLIVAGGGGGGGASTTGPIGAGGGGGAGAVRSSLSSSVAVGTYPVVVGTGGAGGAASVVGTNGGNSSFNSITSTGGGGGGSDGATKNGQNGGSGGGAGAAGGGSGTGGTGSTGGNAGGSSNNAGNPAAGAGGGAGAVGGSGSLNVAGYGGDGVISTINGASTYYGGGGGGAQSSGGAPGGLGGGGIGAGVVTGTAGTDGLGGGGGGGIAQLGFNAGYDGGDGVVYISYPTGAITATGGTITTSGDRTIHQFTTSGNFVVSSISSFTGGFYYVSYNSAGKIKLSAKYDPYEENELTHGTTGSITFSTVATPGAGIAKAVEKYGTATSIEYRYYVLDNNSRVWVYDTQVFDTNGTLWMLTDPTNYSSYAFTGMAVLNGVLFAFNSSQPYVKNTVNLGAAWSIVNNAKFTEPFNNHINFAYVGNQGKLYYTDGNYIGEFFPTTSLLTSLANVQSYCQYTASTTTGTVTSVFSGSLPYTADGSGVAARIPVVFFTDVYGTLPTAITAGTVYWAVCATGTSSFQVFSAKTGGAALDIGTGAVGKQYFNTFYVNSIDSGINGTNSTVQYTQQRLNLPANEVAQTMVEVGNQIIIGGKSNVLYPWNQVDATPSDFIVLPENDVKTMINVNNMVYVFAGYKGNVYITNGSVASLALKIPDYCAGVPGTQSSYIEPYFTWFDAEYIRGRVYCSILDQTADKAGNTGGVWSFVPSQNVDPNQQIGNALRLENQNSYGDYDGCARLIIANQEQYSNAPQYWTWWQDSYSIATSAFGIDTSASTPVTTYVVETDLVPTGTLLSKDTFTQLEYKLSTPLLSGDSMELQYRLNSTAAWASCGTVNVETENPISGYYNMAFQKTQWLQFRAVATTNGTLNSSFTRLAQIRLR